MVRSVAKRTLGAAWLLLWCGVLWCVATPWRALGGLESELTRWLAWWALTAGLAMGYTIGRAVRAWAASGPGRTHARSLRLVFYPPAAITVIALGALGIAGSRGPTGVVAMAFLAYWAGLDVAIGAVPLMDGKDYAFDRALVRDDRDDETGSEPAAWDRF